MSNEVETPARRKPVLVFVASSDWDSVQAKGVAGMLQQFDEGGFFDQVIFVHPFAKVTRAIPLGNNKSIEEIGTDRPSFVTRSRIIKYLFAPYFVARAIFLLRSIIRSNGADAVRAGEPYWSGTVAWAATRLLPVKLVVSIHADWDHLHGVDPVGGAPKILGSRRLAKWLERFVLRQADRVFVIRKSLGVYAIRSGARSDDVRLIPHGIDLLPFMGDVKHFTHPKLLELDESVRIISFAGRLSRENYVDDLFPIARGLNDLSNWMMIVAGGGPEEARLVELARQDAYLSQRMIFTGFMDRDEIFTLRRRSFASVVLMGGYSLIEAAAAGRPVLSYDVAWHSELVINGETGILAKEYDIASIIAGLRTLLLDPILADTLGSQARSLAFEKFSLEAVQGIRIKHYRELMQSR